MTNYHFHFYHFLEIKIIIDDEISYSSHNQKEKDASGHYFLNHFS